MIKKALSEYKSSSLSSSYSSVNGRGFGAMSAEKERRRNGKGARVKVEDTTHTDPVVTIEKVASTPELSVYCNVDASDWCPSSEVIKCISPFFTKNVRVEIYPRSLVADVWSKDHDCKEYTKDYYAFRAYAGKDYCKIFVDETETKESALWVFLHELAHISLASAPFIFKAYRHLTPHDYFSSDDAHERDPEEQMANAMAMSWMDMLGYGKVEYPRHWWRKRTIMSRQISTDKAASISAYAVLRMYTKSQKRY